MLDQTTVFLAEVAAEIQSIMADEKDSFDRALSGEL